MVLCFSMRSCGILQLVSYRLKKYIYFLSKISAWKGGFYFTFFFVSYGYGSFCCVHRPCLSVLLFILCVGEKRRLDSVRPCTVWTVSMFVCIMVCFCIMRQFCLFSLIFCLTTLTVTLGCIVSSGAIICELGMMWKEAVVAWLEGFFCRDWWRTREACRITGLRVLKRGNAFCLCRPSDASWLVELYIS